MKDLEASGYLRVEPGGFVLTEDRRLNIAGC